MSRSITVRGWHDFIELIIRLILADVLFEADVAYHADGEPIWTVEVTHERKV